MGAVKGASQNRRADFQYLNINSLDYNMVKDRSISFSPRRIYHFSQGTSFLKRSV